MSGAITFLLRPLPAVAHISGTTWQSIAVIGAREHAGETCFVVVDPQGVVTTLNEEHVRITDDSLRSIANESDDVARKQRELDQVDAA